MGILTQGVCSWTTGIGEDDPPVWAHPDGESVEENEQLSRFLVTVAILEAALGSHVGASASWLHRDRFAALGPLRRLPFSSWRGFPEGATFYASDGLLAASADNSRPGSSEGISVWVAARDPQALWALDPLIDESWEHDSREN